MQIKINKKMKSKLRKPSKEVTEILSKNIRNFRKTKDLSQESLAEVCNLHRTYIGAIERGERNVTLSTLEVIANALHISIQDLLTDFNKTREGR